MAMQVRATEAAEAVVRKVAASGRQDLVMVLGTAIAIWPERYPYVPARQHTAGQVEMTAAPGSRL